MRFSIPSPTLSVLAVLTACGGAGGEQNTTPAPVSPDSVEVMATQPAPEPALETPPAGPLETARILFAALAASDIPTALSLVAPERREPIIADQEIQDIWVQAWTVYQVEVTDVVDLEEGGTRAFVSVNLIHNGVQARSTRVRFDLIDGQWYLNEN